MATLSVPNTLQNGTPNDAQEVQENFDAVVGAVNDRVDKSGDQMTGELRNESGSPFASIADLAGVAGVASAKTGSVSVPEGNLLRSTIQFDGGGFASPPTVLLSVRAVDVGGGVQQVGFPPDVTSYGVSTKGFTLTAQRKPGITGQAVGFHQVIVDWVAIGDVA